MSKVAELTSAPPTGKKAVLLFWAPWHESSVESGSMGQVLKALAASSSNDGTVFGRVEAEQVQSLTDQYSVTAVPTFVLLDAAGTVIKRLEGDEDVAGVTLAVQNLIQATTSGTELPAPVAPTTTITPEERVNQRLQSLIRSSDVMLFMKGQPAAPRCGFSRQVVELLEEEKIPFGSFDILEDETVRQELKKFSNWPTYPQLYTNGELIGGLDIIKEMKEEGPTLRDQLGISADKVAAPTETLDDRLAKLIRRHKVMLFMKGLPSAPQCGFSRQIVELLNDMGVAYDTFNVLDDEEVRQGLKTFSDWPTYPQLFANGDLIGGLDIVKELAESGEIDSMIK